MMDVSALSLRQRRILKVIQQLGSTTRKEVAELLDLPMPTVTRLVSDMRDRGMVQEDAGVARPARGRPNTTVRLRDAFAYSIGVDFSAQRWSWAICDANANVVSSGGPKEHGNGLSRMSTTAIIEELRSAVVAAGIAWSDVAVIVFAVHAIVAANGDIYESFDQRQMSFNIDQVAAAASGKLCVSNDPARMYAVVEHDPAIDHPDSAYVLYGRRGHGMGLMVCGKMLRTFNGISGEIGHIVVGPNTARSKGSKAFRALDECSNGNILIETAMKSGWGAALAARSGRELGVKDICDAARDGHPGAIQLMCQHAEMLAPALASTVSLVGSETVVLGGEWTDAGEAVLRHLASHIKARVAGALSERLSVRYARYGLDGIARGAAIFGTRELLSIDEPVVKPIT